MCRACPITEKAPRLSSRKSLSPTVAVYFVDQNRICLPVANTLHNKSGTLKSVDDSERDRWTKYLGGKGITTNPFRRSRWESHPHDFKRALGLNETGVMMKFNISEDLKTQLLLPVTRYDQQVKKWRFGKDQVQISVISSVPGGGKTRLLLELLSLLPEFRALFYVTFNNASELNEEYDDMHNWVRFRKSIAMRILFQALKIQEALQSGPSFNSPLSGLQYGPWLKEVSREQLKEIHNIPDAMRLLGGDPTEKCILAVDEANRLVDHKLRSSALPDLIRVLGEAMLETEVFSFMAGTLSSSFAAAASTSGYGINKTALPLLTHVQESAILDDNRCLSRVAWQRCDEEGHDLLSLLGGHPRLLEIYITEFEKALRNDSNLEHVKWVEIERMVRHSSTAQSIAPALDAKDAKRLVDVIVLRQEVQASWSLPSLITYESLQQHSTISLQPAPGVSTMYYATTPLLAFESMINTVTQRDGCEVVYKDLSKLLSMRPTNWSDFEKFLCFHTAIRNCLFATRSSDALRLSQLYADGYGGAGDTAINFVTKDSRVIRCSRQFPKTSSIKDHKAREFDFADGNCYLNSPDAPFGDFFWVCEEDIQNDGPDADTIDDEGAMGTRKLMMSMSCKRYKKNLTFESCIEEHEKNLQSWNEAKDIRDREHYRVITIVITTGQVKPPNNHREHEDLLVIDTNMLTHVYGILTPLLITGLDKRFSINRADYTKLSREFGESAAERILNERKLGFKDKADFLKRLPKLPKPARLEKILDNCLFS